jgi:hypothetical protein
MSSYKLIRELREFQKDPSVKTSDYFMAASNPDGSAVEETFRIKVSDLVGEYNKEKANEQADPNNPLGNNTASEVEIVNGQEVIVDATPITSANLDSLVDPGSGLEVVSTCYDASYTEILCESPPGTLNPLVKYKKKKLSFAKSASSKVLTLYVNNTGADYLNNKSGFAVGSDGSVSQRFLNLRGAYQYINDEIVSTSITINIFIETDTDEGFIYGNGYMLSLPINKINVYGSEYNESSLKVIKLRLGVGYTLASDPALSAEWNGVPQQKAGVYQGKTGAVMSTLPAGVDLYQFTTLPFWITTNTYWRGIHFVLETYTFGVFAAYRQTKGTDGYFAQCKWSIRDYNTSDGTRHGLAQIFDVRDGSRLHIQNINDGSPTDDLRDPANKGGFVSGLELDLDDLSYVGNLFLAEDSSKILTIEYQGGLFNPNTELPSRICFSSNVNNISNFVALKRNSTFQQNALVTRALGVTLGIDFSIYAEGFCTIATSTTLRKEDGGQETNRWPGTTFYSPAVIQNVDVRNAAAISNGILHELDAYYDNYTAWSAP